MKLKDCFQESRIRGLVSVCEETGLPPEKVAQWVKDEGGYVYSCQHKGNDRLFCRLPDPPNELPNIFEIY